MLTKIAEKIKLSGNQQKVFKNVFWSLSGKAVSVLNTLLVGIFVARYLGADRFGLMNYVVGYVTLFSILATFGMDSIEIRELASGKRDKDTVIFTSLCIRLVLALSTMLIIFITLLFTESDHQTILFAMIYSLMILCSAFNIFRNYFTAIIVNEYIVKSEMVRWVVISFVEIGFLMYHLPLIYFMCSATLGYVLIANGYLVAYRKIIGKVVFKFDWELAKSLLRSAFPLLLSGTAVIIYQKIDQVMIRNMIDNKAVGQFSVASKITELVIFLPTMLGQTWMPLLVKAHQTSQEEYIKKRQQFVNIMFWVAMVMALVISLSAYPVIITLYGKGYLQSVKVLQIMAFKAIFVALFASTGQLIIIENIHKYAVMRNIFGCVIAVGLNFFLIPRFGIIGSAWATIATMAFSGYFSHLFIKPYRFLFKIQTASIFKGWISLFQFKKILSRKKQPA